MFAYFNNKSFDNKSIKSTESFFEPKLDENSIQGKPSYFNVSVSEIEESIDKMLKSLVQLIGWQREFFQEKSQTLGMYTSFFQTNIDNGIEDIAKLGIKVIDRLEGNEFPRSLVVQKNCIDKYLATVKGKANLSESFISSVTDLNRFMVKLCEIFKFSQNGSYSSKNIISFMDEILDVDKDMTKAKYDLYYDFFVAKTDDEGENISLLTKLQTVSDLANELILAISDDHNDKSKLKFETYGTDDNTDKSLLRDDEEMLSNGTISKLILSLTNVCTTILDRVSEFDDLTKGVEKLKSINGVKLDESRQKMFNAFAMCIVSFADAFSSFINFTFDFYAYLSNFIAFNKSAFTGENPLVGIN